MTVNLEKPRISVIGAGNLGTCLMYSLVNRGYRLSGIYKKSKFNLYGSKVTGDLSALMQGSDIIIIATQESRIEEAARMAALSGEVRGKVFFHTANALTSDSLAPLKKAGAHVASFSPLQTFPPFNLAQPEDVFSGIYFLLEGDSEAVAAAEKIAADLNAFVQKVDKKKKAYFHIAGVAASNFLIAILKLAERQLKKTAAPGGGSDLKVLFPLIDQTLKNIEKRGVEASLTGPFKRKETAIIQKHLDMLEHHDAALYKALTDFLAVE